MRSGECSQDDYDLVAFRDNVEHVGSRVGDRSIEHLVELSPSTRSDLGAHGSTAMSPIIPPSRRTGMDGGNALIVGLRIRNVDRAGDAWRSK